MYRRVGTWPIGAACVLSSLFFQISKRRVELNTFALSSWPAVLADFVGVNGFLGTRVADAGRSLFGNVFSAAGVGRQHWVGEVWPAVCLAQADSTDAGRGVAGDGGGI